MGSDKKVIHNPNPAIIQMKTFCLATIIAVPLLLCSIVLQAQTKQPKPKKVCLDNTEQFYIESKYVAGENYIIQVGLPIGYSPSKKSIPSTICIGW